MSAPRGMYVVVPMRQDDHHVLGALHVYTKLGGPSRGNGSSREWNGWLNGGTADALTGAESLHVCK